MDLTQFIDGAAILSAKGVICDRCFTVMIDPRIVTSDSHGMKCIHRLCQGCIDPANVCFIHGNNIVQIIEDVQAIKNMQGLAVKCPRFVLGCKMMDKFGELNGHKCDFEPISCKSCKKLLFRVDYESHLDRECEEIVVSCPLEFTGCNCPRMKRKEMKVHFANSMQKHFNLLFASYVSDCADSKKAARMKSEFDSVNCESAVDSKQWRLKLRKGARVDVCDKNVWCAGIVVDQSANQLLVHLLGQDPVSDLYVLLKFHNFLICSIVLVGLTMIHK
jgi:phage FluMu protein Com